MKLEECFLKRNEYRTKSSLCFLPSQHVSINGSIMTLVAIALDRYRGIMHPLLGGYPKVGKKPISRIAICQTFSVSGEVEHRPHLERLPDRSRAKPPRLSREEALFNRVNEKAHLIKENAWFWSLPRWNYLLARRSFPSEASISAASWTRAWSRQTPGRTTTWSWSSLSTSCPWWSSAWPTEECPLWVHLKCMRFK